MDEGRQEHNARFGFRDEGQDSGEEGKGHMHEVDKQVSVVLLKKVDPC